MADRSTVLVMPRWTGADGLAERLGPGRAAALGAVLHERALAAAGAMSPATVHASGPLPTGNAPADLAAAVAEAWPDPGTQGPLIMLWPDLPRWRSAHLAAALSDLADGCDLVLGPVFDGGFYLLALSRPIPGLFELPPRAWRSPDAMPLTVALAAKDRVTVGLLRAERALRTPDDVAAARADPLLDEQLKQLLG